MHAVEKGKHIISILVSGVRFRNRGVKKHLIGDESECAHNGVGAHELRRL